jgi:hypothetical protein
MKVNELRVGNLVSINGQNIVVESICQDGINVYNGAYDGNSLGISCEHEFLEIEGVIPDESLIVRFGFDRLYDKYFGLYAGKFTIRYIYTYSGGTWYFELEEERLNLKFAHQLQNLYFALVGEELVLQD